jgi:hypothetical protein
MGNLNKLQEVLLSLTYSEMMIFAQWFADADKDGDAAINDPQFWAYIINDWAQNAELEEDTQ